MNQTTCTLCGLPTPDPPITAPEVKGEFCCAGCLQVHELLQQIDGVQAEQIRRETIARKRAEWEAEKPPKSAQEAYLNIDGMHCATCESFIEAMCRRQEGIYKSEASYAAELVKIYYNPEKLSEQTLPSLISKMGYKAYPVGRQVAEEDNFSTYMRLLLGGIWSLLGLIIYIIFLYPVYITGAQVVPFAGEVQYFFIAQIFVMSSLVIFYTGFPILRGAWVSLSVMKPNMDLLIAIAALSAYLFSTVALFMGINEIYFDVAMTVIMAVSLGKFYESRLKKDKNSLLTELMEHRVKEARVRRNGLFATVSLEDVLPGEEVMVRAGERIPVDGTIVEGRGVINEALITGESLPVSKARGDRAVSGTLLTQHALTIQTDEKLQNTLEKMIRLMWDIQAGHSGKQRLADKIAAYFVPGVLLLGIITFCYRFALSSAILPSLLAALVVLIVSCPCALGLATPLAVASGLRDALKQNIIFKTGAVFEEKGDPDIIAFDKTGTLTTGQMQLVDQGSNQRAFNFAQAVEQYSSHPAAKAIAQNAGKQDFNVQHFESYSQGVSAEIKGLEIWLGKPEWVQQQGAKLSVDHQRKIEVARKNGHLPTAVAWNNEVQSILVVGDQLRDEAASFITALKKQGKKIAIITGDSDQAARPIKEVLQPDFLFTEAKPESKTAIIKELQAFGSVAMIGDGSNDALALADANLGLAFGDLTAIAAESAQVVIPGDHLQRIVTAFGIMKQTKLRIRQNLGWAFLYNATAIPLAVAGLINPLFAALAMAGSSLLVVSNSSRRMKVNEANINF